MQTGSHHGQSIAVEPSQLVHNDHIGRGAPLRRRVNGGLRSGSTCGATFAKVRVSQLADQNAQVPKIQSSEQD